ncbi:MAG: biopolymer transporter ExbD [Oligoflexia bacterium]|nr:biopolymer transporter ExbD [Oligoflexia bacterium]MBF0366062.1 biopolymer transporter ExbD [Oligoflexia bacterium]
MALRFDNDTKEDILAEINMTPLIDIMLVLLIVFMVTSSITLESGLDIELPKTSAKTEQKSNNVVIISLDAAGTVSIQGKKIEKKDQVDLKAEIASALTREKSDEVIFEGDTSSTVGKMIEIMDIAKSAGAQKFAVATDTASGAAPVNNGASNLK